MKVVPRKSQPYVNIHIVHTGLAMTICRLKKYAKKSLDLSISDINIHF